MLIVAHRSDLVLAGHAGWGCGVMEYWKNGNVGRTAEPSPAPRQVFSILPTWPSWPQPYFIGVLCLAKLATKLAKLPLKLAGELVVGGWWLEDRGLLRRRTIGKLSSPRQKVFPIVTSQWNQGFLRF